MEAALYARSVLANGWPELPGISPNRPEYGPDAGWTSRGGIPELASDSSPIRLVVGTPPEREVAVSDPAGRTAASPADARLSRFSGAGAFPGHGVGRWL